MADLKYKYAVYNVDEDGDLKFLFNYNTDKVIQKDSLITCIQLDKNKRVYYGVQQVLNVVKELQDQEVIDAVDNPILYVKTLVDEDIFN